MLPRVIAERTGSKWPTKVNWRSYAEDILQQHSLEGQALHAQHLVAPQFQGVFTVGIPREDALNKYVFDLVDELHKRLVDNASQPCKVFAKKVYGVPGVQSVYAKIGDDRVVYLWTVVKADVYELREQIYSIEAEMYDLFPLVKFDFHVLTLERLKNKNISLVLPAGFSKLARR